ncbi:hypothetical protein TrVE_jg3422 [Triparma verrucosa]|uniref:Uncharacterized protein n=1 Tax=Triparma verrucosa TaxID=1606542 RepID=A0A9W7CBD4_9STRA|nr:hypothetical protein TrVE_jg3422 [Triparma verrucosa]
MSSVPIRTFSPPAPIPMIQLETLKRINSLPPTVVRPKPYRRPSNYKVFVKESETQTHDESEGPFEGTIITVTSDVTSDKSSVSSLTKKGHKSKHSRGSSLESLASISSSIIGHLTSPSFMSFNPFSSSDGNDTKKQRIIPIPSPPDNYPPQKLDVYFNQMKALGSIGDDLDCLGLQSDITIRTANTEHSDSTGSEGITEMWRNA